MSRIWCGAGYGRAVGAEQVIYIEMLAFQDHMEGQVPRPFGACRVRVIDVTNRHRLYPPPDSDPPYRLLTVNPTEVDPELYRSRATRAKISERLAMEMGDSIAKLFYRHEPREIGVNLTPK